MLEHSKVYSVTLIILQTPQKVKQDAKIDKIPFDETSKYLDFAFDGEKEATLTKQFMKHAKDKFKCFCSICLNQDIPLNLSSLSPYKLNRSLQSPVKQKSNILQLSSHEGNLGQKQAGQDQPEKESTQEERVKESAFDNPIRNHDSELCFLLKRLVPPSRVNRSLRLFLPETVIFWNGEAKLLVFTNQKDSQLKFIKQKEKLQLNELRKFFNERRTKYKQGVESKLEEQRNFGLNEARYIKRGDNKLLDSQYSQQQSGENANINRKIQDRQINRIRASFYSKPNTPSQQDSFNFKQFEQFPQVNKPRANSTKHSDGNNINNFSSQGPPLPEKESKDAVIQKLDSNTNPNSDHTVVISETDFLVLMMKRKVKFFIPLLISLYTFTIFQYIFCQQIDPIWTSIHYLQNFIKTRRIKFQFKHYHFEYEELKDDELFYRALKDIQTINGEISSVSSEYLNPEIEEEFEMRTMYENIEDYQKYMTCKMFHFMQTFHSVTVTQMDTEWLCDDISQLYLINCKNIQFFQQGRSYITTEMYFKKIEEIAEKKLKLREGMEEKYKDYRKEAISMFSDAMLDNYEKKKQKLGIVKSRKARQEGEISDEVFSQIYPEISFKLSDLLNTNAPIKVLQKEIIGDKQPTLRDFTLSRNSQMFSNVYRSPTKLNSDGSSQNSSLSFRQTLSILNKTSPPYKRILSAHTQALQKKFLFFQNNNYSIQIRKKFNENEGGNVSTNSPDQDSKEKTKFQDSMNDKIISYGERSGDMYELHESIENSSPIQKLKVSIPTLSPIPKKIIKVKKNTLPFFLFSPPESSQIYKS